MFFSLNINIFRDPRWGRGQETYGEDPDLTGARSASPSSPAWRATIRSIWTWLAATAKHYAYAELLRHGFDAKASVHDIEDTYLPAFREAVVAGKVKAAMRVYNAINGVPGCASEFLLMGHCARSGNSTAS